MGAQHKMDSVEKKLAKLFICVFGCGTKREFYDLHVADKQSTRSGGPVWLKTRKQNINSH